MTFTRFVVKNVTRNKRRTIFTVVSIAFSLFLLLVLYTVLDRMYNPATSTKSPTRLVVERSTSLADFVPISAQSKIESVPHVSLVMPFQWLGGLYIDEKHFFAQLGGDPEKLFLLYPEFNWSPGSREAFKADRRAAIVGQDLMDVEHWKVGDHVTIKRQLFPVDLEFTIVGTYTVPKDMDRNAQKTFYFRYDYLDESMGRTGHVGTFWLLADKPENVPAITAAIDGMFHNTPSETKTMSEKAFQLSFAEMLGNLQKLFGSIAIVVVFTMLLVVGSTMAMTIRERLKEVAILKSIGFKRMRIMSLLLGESLLLGFLGFAVAALMVVALGSVNLIQASGGIIDEIKPKPELYGMVLGISLFIGFVSGLLPAIRASGLPIAEAIRRME